MQKGSRGTRNRSLPVCKSFSLQVRSKSLSTLYSFQTEGSWGRHLRWRCIGKATGLALPITHRRGRHIPTQPAPHTAWALSSKISGMISVKLGVYFCFLSSKKKKSDIQKDRAGIQFGFLLVSLLKMIKMKTNLLEFHPNLTSCLQDFIHFGLCVSKSIFF